MGEVGIILPDTRVELLDGEILLRSQNSPLHCGTVDRLSTFYVPRVIERAICPVKGPIGLSEFSEPEPDIALLKCRADFYMFRHPIPGDVLLVIE